MTTTTIDISYGTRPVPFRLPYLSVRRRRAPGTALPRAGAGRRAVADALAGRERATDRALAVRAGAGV